MPLDHAVATRDATTTSAARILLVEDNPGDARLIQICLAEGAQFNVTHAERLSEAIERLASQVFDVVLLDLSLPDAQGMATFAKVSLAAPDVPVVVLTGLDDDRTALAIVERGAQDYVVKGNLNGPQIVRTIRYAIERHRLLTRLEAAQHHESEIRDKFLAHVSHELRSPLAVSYLYTTNVLDGLLGDLNAEQRQHLQVAVEALRDQQRMVDDLLATVRADAPLITLDWDRVSLMGLIDETVQALQSARATIVCERTTMLPAVYGDARRIHQILTNLLDNAIKFTPDGGVVGVRAFTPPTDPGFVQVDIEDDGPGVPAGAALRIFDRLYCAEQFKHTPGIGLGLYLSRLLVARHGGRIWVEPRPPQGSRFSFTLPFIRQAEAR